MEGKGDRITLNVSDLVDHCIKICTLEGEFKDPAEE